MESFSVNDFNLEYLGSNQFQQKMNDFLTNIYELNNVSESETEPTNTDLNHDQLPNGCLEPVQNLANSEKEIQKSNEKKDKPKSNSKPKNKEKVPYVNLRNKKDPDVKTYDFGKKLKNSMPFPQILLKPFKTVDNDKIECYLYRFHYLQKENETLPYGVLFPERIPYSLNIPLFNFETYQREDYVLTFVEKQTIPFQQFKDYMLLFYLKITYDLFKDTAVMEEKYLEECFKKLIDPSRKIKRYIVIPLTNEAKPTLNMTLAKNLYDIYKMTKEFKKANSLDKTFSLYGDNLKENIKDKIFVTSYRNFNYVTMNDLLNKNEDFNTFMKKVSFNNENQEKYLIDKYFQEVSNDVTVDELLYKAKTGSEVVNCFRDLEKKYNMKIDRSIPFVVYGKRLNTFKKNLTYNKNKPLETKPKEDDRLILHPIYPADTLVATEFTPFLVDEIMKLPSLLLSLENYLIPFEYLTNKLKLEVNLDNDAYKYFTWALAPTSAIQEFNYETLETLGDSILKFITTFAIYMADANDLLNIKYNVGDLEYIRKKYICNQYIMEKSTELNIAKYVLDKINVHIVDYSFPLSKRERTTLFKNEITNKNLADIFESTLGAVFMYYNSFTTCLDYLISIDFLNCSNSQNSIKKKFFQDANKIYDVMLKIKDKFFFSPNFKYSEIDSLHKDITFGELYRKFGRVFYQQSIFTENSPYRNFIDFQDNCLHYRFNNPHLLELALTHKSVDADENYEKFELLGDAIVEAYVSSSVYRILGPYLYNNLNSDDIVDEKEKMKNESAQKFSQEKMTQIKSILCSNDFMCRVAILLNLPFFIRIATDSASEKKFKTINHEDFGKILEEKFNNGEKKYEEKVIADLFEALIAAIFMDSNLESCFNFLNYVYEPFIAYCALYPDFVNCSLTGYFTFLINKESNRYVRYDFTEKDKMIFCEAIINEKDVFCRGKGINKEEAKQNAAIEGLKKLNVKLNI